MPRYGSGLGAGSGNPLYVPTITGSLERGKFYETQMRELPISEEEFTSMKSKEQLVNRHGLGRSMPHSLFQSPTQSPTDLYDNNNGCSTYMYNPTNGSYGTNGTNLGGGNGSGVPGRRSTSRENGLLIDSMP